MELRVSGLGFIGPRSEGSALTSSLLRGFKGLACSRVDSLGVLAVVLVMRGP